MSNAIDPRAVEAAASAIRSRRYKQRHIERPAGPEDEIEQAHAALSAAQPFIDSSDCPCAVLGKPCMPNCTCVEPLHSGGCLCCARYGSEEQRKGAAQIIQSRMTCDVPAPQPFMEREGGEVMQAARNLLADVRRRYPGEELRCEYMRALDTAVEKETMIAGGFTELGPIGDSRRARKTQTRRIIKPQPELTNSHPRHWHIRGCGGGCFLVANATDQEIADAQIDYVAYCVGDRLWVRESIHLHGYFGMPLEGVPQIREGDHARIWSYAADNVAPGDHRSGRPSIHMPRWMSRLTLIVTNVRVQRLQEITHEDALAEGIVSTEHDDGRWIYPIPGTEDYAATADAAYAGLWEKLHGFDSFAANPWVVALTFSVHRCNIDALTKEPICEEAG